MAKAKNKKVDLKIDSPNDFRGLPELKKQRITDDMLMPNCPRNRTIGQYRDKVNELGEENKDLHNEVNKLKNMIKTYGKLIDFLVEQNETEKQETLEKAYDELWEMRNYD